MRDQRVLLVASEGYPLAKTGGLGDYTGALGKALTREGCDVRILLPGYPEALDRLEGRLERVELGPFPDLESASLVQGEMPGTAVPVWLVDSPALYQRPGGLYQDADGTDWPDNARRFALFARAAERLSRSGGPVDWRPDIVHLNDWQTGPLAAMLARDRAGRVPTVFTIHNLAFRGLFGAEALDDLGLPRRLLVPDGLEFWGQASFLKAGIRYADRVTTVSEAYAREILTPAFGDGLEVALGARPEGVIGIRNGIDEDEWNPVADRHLPAGYDVHDLRGKAVCKSAAKARFGLEPDLEAPLVAYLCRLTGQKMADVVLDALPDLVARGVQLVVMGRGDPGIEAAFRAAGLQHPGRVGVLTGYDEPRAHLVVAGADMVLPPARFEPCGLMQMYAMRYGTVPIASRVGGLAETVTDLSSSSPGVADATGFLFDDNTVAGLTGAVDRAIACHRQPFLWRRLVTNGMRRDFSWTCSAQRYLELYHSLAPDSTVKGLWHPRGGRQSDRRIPTASQRAGGRPIPAAARGTTPGPKKSAMQKLANPVRRSVDMTYDQTRIAQIQRRAYEIWERNGRIAGCQLDHWLQAERELADQFALPAAGQEGTAGSRRSRPSSRKTPSADKPSVQEAIAAPGAAAAAESSTLRGNKRRGAVI